MKTQLLFIISLFIYLNSFAQLQFIDHTVVDRNTYLDDPNAIFTIDVNNDGYLDLVTSSYGSNIVWQKNDGNENFSLPISLNDDQDKNHCEIINVLDINSDGYKDILFISYNKVGWYKNLNNDEKFEKIIIYENRRVSSVFISDINGDNDMDILVATVTDDLSNNIMWIESIEGTGNFKNPKYIPVNLEFPSEIHATDLDNDGDEDIVVASYVPDKLIWFENIDGRGNFSEEKIILENEKAIYLKSGDIDNDGDIDLVLSSPQNNKIFWLKNTDGIGNFNNSIDIVNSLRYIGDIKLHDIDNDGDLDLFATFHSEYNKIIMFKNLNGKGDFGDLEYIIKNLNGSASISFFDIDGDDNLDLLVAAEETSWYRNTDGFGNFGKEHIISSNRYYQRLITSGDIDNDGDIDILSFSMEHVYSSNTLVLSWFENSNDIGNFEYQYIIDTVKSDIKEFHLIDIDCDNDLDIIASISDTIVSYEYLQGEGKFGKRKTIYTGYNYIDPLIITDLDNDNDLDIFINYVGNNGIIYRYNNIDCTGDFQLDSLHLNIQDISSSIPLDVDNDGDMDIVIAEVTAIYYGPEYRSKISWLENIDGEIDENKRFISKIDGYNLLHSVDLINDNKIDILALSFDPSETLNSIYYLVKNNENIGFNSPKIINGNIDLSFDFKTGDLNGDNKIDLLITNYINGIEFFEYNESFQRFTKTQSIVSNIRGTLSFSISDINNDGKNDIITTYRNSIIWHENIGATNIDEVDRLKFEVFPNPTNNILNIRSQKEFKSIEIYNSLGQLVVSNSYKTVIDISSLNRGLYFLRVIDENGKFGIQKVIKE